jgi:hypothetical protein
VVASAAAAASSSLKWIMMGEDKEVTGFKSRREVKERVNDGQEDKRKEDGARRKRMI